MKGQPTDWGGKEWTIIPKTTAKHLQPKCKTQWLTTIGIPPKRNMLLSGNQLLKSSYLGTNQQEIFLNIDVKWIYFLQNSTSEKPLCLQGNCLNNDSWSTCLREGGILVLPDSLRHVQRAMKDSRKEAGACISLSLELSSLAFKGQEKNKLALHITLGCGVPVKPQFSAVANLFYQGQDLIWKEVKLGIKTSRRHSAWNAVFSEPLSPVEMAQPTLEISSLLH